MSALSLRQRLVDWLNGTVYAPGHPITNQADRDALQLGTLLDTVAALDNTETGTGSDLIGVYDEHSVFTGTNLTDVLYELYQAATTANSDAFTDTNSFYATDTVGAALVALGVALGGTNSTTRAYTGGTGTRLTANDTFFTALNKLDQGFVDLIAVTTGKGAALVGIEDAGGYITGATVEAGLQELGKERLSNIIADPGTGQAIPVTKSGYLSLTIGSAGAETNTLDIPTFIGQEMVIYAGAIGSGTRAITASQGINQANNTVMTFAQPRDFIKLVAIATGGNLRWQVESNDGVALS